MKTVAFFMNYTRLGGAEKYVYSLANRLVNNGTKVFIYSGSISNDRRPQKWISRYLPTIYIDKHRFCDLGFQKKIIWLLRYFIFSLYLLIHYLSLRKADIFICQQPWPSSFCYFAAKILNKKVITIVHHVIPNEYSMLNRKYSDISRVFIAISEEVSQYLINKNIATNVALIHNPIELPIKLSLHKHNDKRVITMISHIYEQKHESIIGFCECAKLFNSSDYEFRLIGEISTSYAAKIVGKYAEYVSFKGLLSEDNVFLNIIESSVIVAVGRSAIEGLMMGKCVIIAGHVKGPFGGNFGGLVNESNLDDVARYNFSGRHSSQIVSASCIKHSIIDCLSNKVPIFDINKSLLRQYTPDTVYKEFIDVCMSIQ